MELFGEWINPEWLDFIFTSCYDNPEHTFIFLTKRPENISKLLPFPIPDNVWIGVSATDAESMDDRVNYLSALNASIRFISFEPLLGNPNGNYEQLEKAMEYLDWVIIGQQTPVRSSTMPNVGWIEEIVRAADQAGIPVFPKDNLVPIVEQCEFANANTGEWPDIHLRQEFPKVPEKVR